MNFSQGNLLDSRVEALVNTVNTVGVMGKGIALMFKERFPENYKAYAAACKAEAVRVGEMFVTASVELEGPRWIINFPTKQQWYQPTRLEWVRSGLVALKNVIREKQIKSIALPPLGCRYGPYANRLDHLLNGLDGSYLHCDKRISDADPFDTIWFEDSKREKLELYLKTTEAKIYLPALEATDELIDLSLIHISEPTR